MSKKIVAELAKNMKGASDAAYAEHMGRLGDGMRLLAPAIVAMRERGLTSGEISGVLRFVLEEIGSEVDDDE
jgi:hypothetical protein